MTSRFYRFTDKKMSSLIFLTLLLLSCMIPFGRSISNPQPVSPGSVPAHALLLSEESFPQKWGFEPCELPCEDEGDAKATRFFGVAGQPGHVLQEVHYYGSGESAQTIFESFESIDLSTETPVARRPFVPFQTPDEISYRSPIADDQYLVCGIDVGAECRVARRYGQYFIYIFILVEDEVGEGGLRIDEIEPILRALDLRVSKLLNIPMDNLEKH